MQDTNTQGAPLIRLEALAGAGALDQNAYLLSIGALRVLLDAGALDDAAPAWLGRLERAPDWTFISHTHADHAGGLPHLSRRFVRLTWLTSTQTAALLPHAPGQGAPLPIATTLDFEDRGVRVSLGDGSSLAEVGARALVAGHMLGAASLLLDIRAGERFLRFFYLSDFSPHASPGWSGAALPDPAVDPVDVMVMEGVLAGVDKAPDRDAALGALWAEVAGHAGPRLLALSALCQAPLVLSRAPAGLLIHVHDQLYATLAAWSRASGVALPQLRVVSLKDARALLAAGHVVVASGEHLEGGSPAGQLVREIVGLTNARVHVLNSLRARELGQLARRKIGPDELELGVVKLGEATLRRHVAPLHATAPELVRAVATVQPKQLWLVHGRAPELYRLAKRIKREVRGIKVGVMEAGRVVEL
jgi:Cft2 family RNA processing exonuclease